MLIKSKAPHKYWSCLLKAGAKEHTDLFLLFWHHLQTSSVVRLRMFLILEFDFLLVFVRRVIRWCSKCHSLQYSHCIFKSHSVWLFLIVLVLAACDLDSSPPQTASYMSQVCSIWMDTPFWNSCSQQVCSKAPWVVAQAVPITENLLFGCIR